MSVYQVEFSPAAKRDLRKAPHDVAGRMLALAGSLAVEPRPRGCVKLQGRDEIYRVRGGDFRILYSIRDRKLIVLVLNVLNRRDAYK